MSVCLDICLVFIYFNDICHIILGGQVLTLLNPFSFDEQISERGNIGFSIFYFLFFNLELYHLGYGYSTSDPTVLLGFTIMSKDQHKRYINIVSVVNRACHILGIYSLKVIFFCQVLFMSSYLNKD